MSLGEKRLYRKIFIGVAVMIMFFAGGASAERQMEHLGRGVVAVNQGGGKIYVGWRMLATDPEDIAFNLYRSTAEAKAVRLNKEPLIKSTNFVDESADPNQPNSYFVRPIVEGKELEPSAAFKLVANAPVREYISIAIQTPEGCRPSDASVGDLDGDGEYEIILKQEMRPHDNARSGVTGQTKLEAYKLDGTFLWRINLGKNIREGAHYTQFMVYDLDGDGRAEVACKTADGTVDGKGKVIGDADADYRNSDGFILDGPEYLTVFDGLTGGELATVDYIPPRGRVEGWGDRTGNRADRFLAAIAYLDGQRPSLVMCRGYYTRTVLAAWNFRDGKLTNIWTFDSDDGTAGNREYRGQGNHNLSVGDVDGDGKDEIIYGACAIDDDGRGLYSTGLGHGDAMHLSDIDPERDGLEVFSVHEMPRHSNGANLRDAATGEVIWGLPLGDTGRALAIDIDPRYKGFECWTNGSRDLYNCKGERIGYRPRSCNMAVWWDDDLLRELLDGTRIYKWDYENNETTILLRARRCSRNNGSKSNPCLCADILGDWREEVIWRSRDNNQLRIYTTTIPTNRRFSTFMHDPIYRLGIAWQNVGYNQPAHTGFYFGVGMQEAVQPDKPSAKRIKYNFNAGWKVIVGDPNGAESVDFDDSGFKEVTLPYAWNEDEAFKLDIHNLSTGIAWYRKSFKIPAVHTGQKVFLEFEGIRQAGEFFLNGRFIGSSENGVMAFGFDVTELVNFAPAVNVLAVRTDNSWDYREKSTGQRFQWNDRNFNANYGGIVKNVYLHVADRLYQTLPLYSMLGTTGVYIYAQDFDIKEGTAQITAESEVRNEYPTDKSFEYKVIIRDFKGDVIKEFSGIQTTIAAGDTKTVRASATVDNLEFWSWGYGRLYDVYTILKVNGEAVDTVRTRTGFRKTEFGDGMIKLNDRVIQVKGYAQRSSNEWPAVGLSVPPWLSDFSNRLIVEGNGNLVRWMHVTPSKQDVESCDRVGLMQAMPAGDSEKDAAGRQWQQRVELMRDAIIYNRNNPSIIFYEGGNEVISEEHMQELKELRDRYDPHGGRAIGSREMLDSKVAEYGGEMLYINKSAGKPMWAMEYSRDEGLRKYWDEFSPPYHKDGDGPTYRDKPAGEYNRNQDSHAIENVIRWYDYWSQRPGTGKRISSGGVNIIFSDTNTHYRGAENYRRSGEVDPMRIPKDGFFAHQVMWDGWVDIEQPRIHIMGHGNYAKGTKKNIYVVSSAEKVELLVNGKSLGFGKQSYRFLFTFENVEWEAGVLQAVGYDADGNRVCEAEKKTAGEPDGLRLTVNTAPDGLKADGADLALVTVEVVDSQGRRCPTALNMIEFSLDGPAKWRGGIAQGPDNYILSKKLPVECGVNRVLIRSTTQAGKIKLTASSVGLKSASVEIDSKPVEVIDGLSLTMPDANLPCYLERGPTPEGASFVVSRIPVDIVSVTAGANSDQASLSFDDNEMTSWSNDGRLSTAWIRYEFEKAVTVSEVVMKLHNWRRISYSIQIFIDDKKVYKGDTARSLGYVTIDVEPVEGKSLAVSLQGISKDEDGFNIVEITGKKDDAGTAGNEAKGTLRIVEIEIYEKASD